MEEQRKDVRLCQVGGCVDDDIVNMGTEAEIELKRVIEGIVDNMVAALNTNMENVISPQLKTFGLKKASVVFQDMARLKRENQELKSRVDFCKILECFSSVLAELYRRRDIPRINAIIVNLENDLRRYGVLVIVPKNAEEAYKYSSFGVLPTNEISRGDEIVCDKVGFTFDDSTLLPIVPRGYIYKYENVIGYMLQTNSDTINLQLNNDNVMKENIKLKRSRYGIFEGDNLSYSVKLFNSKNDADLWEIEIKSRDGKLRSYRCKALLKNNVYELIEISAANKQQ